MQLYAYDELVRARKLNVVRVYNIVDNAVFSQAKKRHLSVGSIGADLFQSRNINRKVQKKLHKYFFINLRLIFKFMTVRRLTLRGRLQVMVRFQNTTKSSKDSTFYMQLYVNTCNPNTITLQSNYAAASKRYSTRVHVELLSRN